ncbi:MAG TPA: cell wall biosynthesis glycosyltransferase [Bryobacteraceae bacterium]|nr:cell wall biosynthesis glycosyltransferase [Bryobacteraceae bacterium]
MRPSAPGLESFLPADAVSAAAALGRADIVIGIPSYRNARTIGHVVRAAQLGLAKYFPQFTAVIVNSDGGSNDGTREAVLSAPLEDGRVLLLRHPLLPVHRLSMPYHGIPGKGSAFRLIFGMASLIGARACAVVDADLRSITPEWFDLLLRPVLHADFDFVAPYYHRHKYDGTITNSIVYPLTRALYGLRVRQPIGGDFGMSRRLFNRYLERNDWETDVARYGIDIWMTTIAICEGFRVCQSFLGAKLHDAKDPGADLSAMLHQVIGSVFQLMNEYEPVWRARTGSENVDLFGFRYDVGLDPIQVNVPRMIGKFRHGCQDLGEIWSVALTKETMSRISALAREPDEARFHLDDELWVRVIYDFALAFKRGKLDRGHLMRSLTPLYMARVASFVLETEELGPEAVDEKIEVLCRRYEAAKPYLLAGWSGAAPPAEDRRSPAADAMEKMKEAHYD